MWRHGRIEWAVLGATNVATIAYRRSNARLRKVDHPERDGNRFIAHEVVLGVCRAGTVASLAPDLDGDGRTDRRITGAVAAEAGSLGLALEPASRVRVGGHLPRGELFRVTCAARGGAGPVAT